MAAWTPSADGELVPLRHGALLPRVGFGTWPMRSDEATRAVAEALEAGYRLVDTAENYDNERAVGMGIRAGGVPRDQVFVTTKFNRRWHGDQLVRTALDRAVDRLGIDYLDLLMIHWPNPGYGRYVEAWRGMADLLREGKVRAIATSNFKPAHLARLREETGVLPDVNQIQLNPALPRAADREFADGLGIVTQSWAPLGGRDDSMRADPGLARLARRYGKTPAQLILRWHLQLGLAVVVKASDPRHMRDNLAVFDFELAAYDLATFNQLRRPDSAQIDSDIAGH